MKRGNFNAGYLFLFLLIVFVLALFITNKGGLDYSKENEGSIITGEIPPFEGIEEREEECALMSGEEKDNCWTELANEVNNIEGEEKSAAEICLKISDDEKHDECIYNIAYEFASTCELIRTKDENPSEWYNDCIDFIAEDIETCKLIKNDEVLTNDCIYFVSEEVSDCLQINNDETLTDICIADVAKTEAECERIKSERIREECKINVLMNEEE